MTAPELRAFVRAVLDELENEQRTRVVDSLMARAAKGHAGWKPRSPSQRIVDDARSFADAARQVGYADPGDVSEHLRLGTKAFLAGDHASARAVFEALLLPIADGDIDLGQHELVDEVLGVDAHACVAQYVDERIHDDASGGAGRGRAPNASSKSKASALSRIRSRTWKTCRPERCPTSRRSCRGG